MTTWHDKAHRIIASECRASYAKANTKKDGTAYTKHRPYSVPVIAQELVACLNTDNEERAKGLMLAFQEHPDMFSEGAPHDHR